MKNSNAARESELEADFLDARPLDLYKAVRQILRLQAGRNQQHPPRADLMDTFPDPESVNEALRTLKAMTTLTASRP